MSAYSKEKNLKNLVKFSPQEQMAADDSEALYFAGQSQYEQDSINKAQNMTGETIAPSEDLDALYAQHAPVEDLDALYAQYAPKASKPATAKPKKSDGFFDNLSIKNVPENAKNAVGAITEGLADIGQTISYPVNAAVDVVKGQDIGTQQADMRSKYAGLFKENFDTELPSYKAFKVGGNIIGTLPVGGGLGQLAQKAGASAPIVNALSSGGLNIGGDTAKVLSTQGAKNLATRAVGGGITGATSGALIDPESAALSGGISAAIPVAGKVAGATGKAMGIGAKLDDLAKTAIEKYNIPLDRASTSASKMTKATKSLLDDILPFGAGKAQKEATQNAFNREVGKVAGMNAEKLTPDVVKNAKDAIGQAYDKVWGSNKFIVDRQFADDATSLIQDASNKLNPEQSAMLEKHFNNLVNRANNGEIDGKFVNNWQSELRQIVDSETGLHKKFTNDLRQTVLKAFKRNIPAEDAALLDSTNTKYKAFKTLKGILDKGEAGVGGRDIGDVAPSLLSSAVNQSYDNVAASPFGELPRIGSKYLVDRVARTGGGNRALLQQILALGGLGAGAGAVGGAAGLATIPLAYTTQKYLSGARKVKPEIGNLMQSPLLQNLIKANPALVNASRQ